MALSVVPAGLLTTLTGGQYIAGILDSPGAVSSKLWSATTYGGGSSTTPPTTAVPGVAGGAGGPMTAFPTLAAAPTLVVAGDGTNNEQVGYIKMSLTPAPGDVINASSPMNFTVSPNALVIVASTATA